MLPQEKIQNLIDLLRKKNNKISVYGASGKGQALLQFCKLDFKKIDYTFDKSKLKQNCFTPGTNINKNSKILEIACNDGSFLNLIRK